MRKLLDKIIHTDGGNNWWKPELFKKNTLEILPKELQVLENPPDEERNYNCFLHVLGFADDIEFVKNCGGFIYDTFFQRLIDEKELGYTNNPQKGDYILYRDIKNYPNMITHIGIVDDKEHIVSKWAWGPLFKHKVFDVPESYGNDISYIKTISKQKAYKLYKKYKEFNVKLD